MIKKIECLHNSFNFFIKCDIIVIKLRGIDMKIRISIDSACDIPSEIIEKNNIAVMPYFVEMGDKEYRDGVDITAPELFQYVKEKGVLPKTGAPSGEMYREYFESMMEGYDEAIHFTLSSKMSSSYDNAVMGAEGTNVHVFDSKHLSSGIALLVISCIKKLNEGKDLDTTIKELEEERDRVQTSFLIDTLSYMKKGGRCSSVALIASKLLMIKPMIAVKDGAMGVAKKYFGGINGCLLKYVDDLLKTHNPDKSVVFMTHSSKMDAGEKIIQKLKDYGFENIYECDASSTICSHCGPGTLGVLFMDKG